MYLYSTSTKLSIDVWLYLDRPGSLSYRDHTVFSGEHDVMLGYNLVQVMGEIYPHLPRFGCIKYTVRPRKKETHKSSINQVFFSGGAVAYWIGPLTLDQRVVGSIPVNAWHFLSFSKTLYPNCCSPPRCIIGYPVGCERYLWYELALWRL